VRRLAGRRSRINLKRGGEALLRGLKKIFLTLSFVIFLTGITTARDASAAAIRASAGKATAATAGDEAQPHNRRVRRRRVAARRTGKRGHPMTQSRDDSRPRDAGQQDDAAGQKKTDKVDEANKTQPPAPRPRRRYDPVLQPPEKTRVP
jgi:hypothetical protein